MSADEELLSLSATILLVAFSCKRKKESVLNDFGCVPCSIQRRHQRGAYNTRMSELRQADVEGDDILLPSIGKW